MSKFLSWIRAAEFSLLRDPQTPASCVNAASSSSSSAIAAGPPVPSAERSSSVSAESPPSKPRIAKRMQGGMAAESSSSTHAPKKSKTTKTASGPGSGRTSHMDKWMKGVNERIAAKKSDHSMDDEVRIIQQDNTINPVIVEGKRVFGFDIGDVLRIEYICDEPPLGCAWMKEPAYKNKFIAQVVK